MLYIKDYSSLNRLVNSGQREPSFFDELLPLRGKTVTVHTVSACFCGLLSEVSPEKIVLTAPACKNRRLCRKCVMHRVQITVSQITAVFYSYL